MKTINCLALTPGEPAGIGPDLCIRLVQDVLPAIPVAVADPNLLERRAQILGLKIRLRPIADLPSNAPHQPGELFFSPISLCALEQPGKLNSANSPYVIETLRHAVYLCQSGMVQGLVTGPVHKGIINSAGISFTGHTELLAELTQTQTVVMMLALPELRIALATTHLPLNKISAAITPDHLSATLHILHHDLIYRFGIPAPRILVCGLNPHAGENGHLGREEIDVIIPVLNNLRAREMNLIGPIPADTAFLPERISHSDAILAMYHDQGLPVLKHLGFGRAVNITLGLPIIRTSVDHGVALELAGTGRASHQSLIAAFNFATHLIN